MKEIFLAGGCFWGTQHYLKQIRGVISTQTGYANGHTDSPAYEEVYTDTTGHAETVRIQYNPEILPLETLIRLFFRSIDPTLLNRQGNDYGTRYRTGVYYSDYEDLKTIKPIFDEVAATLDSPLAVELLPLESFFPAEEYHQDYLDKNPDGYCHIPHQLIEFARNANK